jgi:hypothetical protein
MSSVYFIDVGESTYTVIDNVTENIVEFVTTEYSLTGVAEVGPPGPQGEPGDEGNPDKNFVHTFTNQSSMIIEHGLDKYPAVYVQDSAGDEVIGDISHLDINTVEINFSSSFSGKAVFN